MSITFASGKHAIAICDICGTRCAYNDLKQIYRAGFPTSLYACPYCWDKDHPQLFHGRKPIRDPQSLKNPRPDTGAAASRGLFTRFKIVAAPVYVSLGSISVTTS